MKEETNEKFKVHDLIISWACIIWAVASIALMSYFSGLNQVTFAIMTCGQLFLVFGIILICRKQVSGAVFTITGLGCIILPAVNEWGYLISKDYQANGILPVLLSTGITLVGLAMLIVPGVLENMAERRCKISIKAECVDLKSTTLADKTVAYAPVYQYTYNENVYSICTEKYQKTGIPNIGEKIEFRINEKKPEDVYIETSKASLMIIYIFGASFFMMGLGMLITIVSL